MTIPAHLRSKTTKDVEIIDSQVAYKGFFEIRKFHARYRLFSGGWSNVVEREVFHRANAVGVLLYDPKRDEVVLIEQFRLGALKDKKSPWLVEIVAGMIGSNETEEEVAIREAQEEADLKIQRLIPIFSYWPSPGGSTEEMTLFCGIVDSAHAAGVHGLEDEHEDIQAHVFKTQDAFELLEKGYVNNACTVIALQWLQLNKDKIACD